MSRQNDFDDRPPSEQLIDLVVYVVPAELWKERLHSAFADVINETISAGFIRVHPETPISHLRGEIQSQLEDEYDLPQEYVFVKNVGRRLTKVRKKQEMQLKVKNFVDPKTRGSYGNKTYACEIFLLEGGSDTQSLHPSSVSSNYRGEPTSQEDPYQMDSYRSKGTFASQKPVPPIKPGDAPSTNPRRAHPATDPAYPLSSGSSSHSSSHPLTNSNTSFNSVHSQTESNYTTRSHGSNISTTGAIRAPVPPVESNPSKTVTFNGHQHPQESQNSHNHHRKYYHRPPTPRPPSVESYGENSFSANQATQWSRQNSRALLISPKMPRIASPHQSHHDRSTSTHSLGQNGQEDLDDHTPPPLSATPTHAMSPYPTARLGGAEERQEEEEGGYLPPLSCTPPPTSPGSQLRPRMKASADKDQKNRTKHQSGSSDGMGNGSDRWEDRNGYLNRSNSYLKREEDARKKQEEEARRRQQEEEMRKRQQEEEMRRRQQEEEMRRQQEEEEARRRQEDQQRLRDEANRRKQREESANDRQRKEEEEARRRREKEQEEAERRRQEQEEERRRREEEENRRREEDENDSQSNHDKQKQTLLEELERLKKERAATEKEREELVRRAKQLQSRSQNKRNQDNNTWQARDVWKKKYFEEKKKSPPLEEQCTKLRQELDAIHRRIVSSLEGGKDKDGRRGAALEKPSPESNVKIQATRLQHEIEDLQRRVETIKMKLTAEMKLRNQAENELRALRAELTQKKINVTLSRRGPRDDNADLFSPRTQQPVSSRT